MTVIPPRQSVRLYDRLYNDTAFRRMTDPLKKYITYTTLPTKWYCELFVHVHHSYPFPYIRDHRWPPPLPSVDPLQYLSLAVEP